MVWTPPTVPPNTRANNTPLPANHISDHNAISDALTAIINVLGTNPEGAEASITALVAKLPLGAIGGVPVTLTSNQTGITTAVDVTGLTRTWTASPSRLYRTSVMATSLSTVGGDIGSLVIANAASASLRGVTTAELNNTNVIVTSFSILESGLSGSVTRKLRAGRQSGTGDVIVGIGSYLLVEDLGLA